MKRKDEFSDDVKCKCLLWCARHCCVCGKDCGVDIEIAHMPGKRRKNDIDSAIPLCYDCHAKIEHYNRQHPRGTMYKKEELKSRRNQVYDQYTRHLVPSIIAKIVQDRELPGVGFKLINHSNFPTAKAKIKLTIFLGNEEIGEATGDRHGYYSGETEWHINPRIKISGNFKVPISCVNSENTHRIQVDMKIIDIDDREHALLPICYTYVRDGNYWFLEPTSFKNLSV